MSDRFSGQIEIGGLIAFDTQLLPGDPMNSTTVLQGLVSALIDDGVSAEYGDGDIVIRDIRDLEDYIVDGCL